MRSVRSSAVVEIQTALRTHLLVTLSLVSPMWVSAAAAEEHEEILLEEDFESGLSRWQLDNADSIAIIPDPADAGNHVLRLTPEENTFTHAILEESAGWSDLRIEGRFLFPTEGDGYLGFIYNYQEAIGAEGVDRMDFGCIYVKSNGSYVRVSPHHDGNPSWRLYEEYRFDLEGDRRIQVGSWYDFRLEVRGRWAELYIEDMSKPVVHFDQTPNRSGAIGLEARPGGGEPVWVDDLRVLRLEPPQEPSPETAASPAVDRVRGARWEILGPFPSAGHSGLAPPELPSKGWQPIRPGPKGMMVTGQTTQYRSGDHDIAYLRARFGVTDTEISPNWLAVSSANRLDVWFNGFYRGTVAEERFIWSDYLTSAEHPGARISLLPAVGENEILIRVHGRRFAGGGLFVDLIRPRESQ